MHYISLFLLALISSPAVKVQAKINAYYNERNREVGVQNEQVQFYYQPHEPEVGGKVFGENTNFGIYVDPKHEVGGLNVEVPKAGVAFTAQYDAKQDVAAFQVEQKLGNSDYAPSLGVQYNTGNDAIGLKVAKKLDDGSHLEATYDTGQKAGKISWGKKF